MKGQCSKLFFVTVAFLLLAGACAAPPPLPTPTPAPTPLDIVQQYQDAVGRHDVDTAMALFTDDATYGWGDYFTTSDKTMIRNWLEYAAGLNSQTKVNDCKPAGPTVTCEWRFVHDCFGAEGAIGAGYDMGGSIVFTVKDGKISEYVFSEKLVPEYSQWGDAFFKWLEDSHPMEIGSVVQSLQTWRFDRDFGQRLLKFCKEQAASLKSAAGATSDLTAPVQAWVDALNSGDVDAALALFADDLKFDVFEYHARNKNELRGIFDWLAGLETKYQIKECQKKEDRVVCTMPVSDACIAGYDTVNGLASTMTFVPTQDGKIAQVNGMVDGFDDYYAKWISPAMSWMRANRAEELAKAESTSDGREAGSINAALCKEYGASLKATPTAAGATKPAGKQVLLVVGLEQSEDMELMLTKEVAVMVSMLEKANYEVVVASASGEPITGGTATLTPDLKLVDVKVDDYVGFMFPCLAVDMDLPPPAEAVRIAKEAVARGKPVAAQNGGVVTLSAAGALKGKQFALLQDPGARMPGGIYKGTGVVQDGNIITSGTCPHMAKMTGLPDGTTELTQKLIGALATSQE